MKKIRRLIASGLTSIIFILNGWYEPVVMIMNVFGITTENNSLLYGALLLTMVYALLMIIDNLSSEVGEK